MFDSHLLYNIFAKFHFILVGLESHLYFFNSQLPGASLVKKDSQVGPALTQAQTLHIFQIGLNQIVLKPNLGIKADPISTGDSLKLPRYCWLFSFSFKSLLRELQDLIVVTRKAKRIRNLP